MSNTLRLSVKMTSLRNHIHTFVWFDECLFNINFDYVLFNAATLHLYGIIPTKKTGVMFSNHHIFTLKEPWHKIQILLSWKPKEVSFKSQMSSHILYSLFCITRSAPCSNILRPPWGLCNIGVYATIVQLTFYNVDMFKLYICFTGTIRRQKQTHTSTLTWTAYVFLWDYLS